jgi:hypothetical protein
MGSFYNPCFGNNVRCVVGNEIWLSIISNSLRKDCFLKTVRIDTAGISQACDHD